MGKRDSNPVQDHHRQQRVKEIKKNKQQRIKARDERVIETKSLKEVEQEIEKLKKRKSLQWGETQKLQRLEKELKLLQQAAKQNPKPNLQHTSTTAKPLTELDDPRKSVYYDERLNPFGAPPPGKPRLYHQRGGGVTMDITLAVVPGEGPPSLPPPPPPPPPLSHSSESEPTPALVQTSTSLPSLPTEASPQSRNEQQAPPPPPPPLFSQNQLLVSWNARWSEARPFFIFRTGLKFAAAA